MSVKIRINSQDLGEIGSIDTNNLFNGESADNAYIEYYNDEHDTDYTYDNFEWSYDHEQIVKELAESSREWLLDNVVGKVVLGIGEILGTYSPKEYNFATDSWESEWDIDEKELRKYIETNAESYKNWYNDNSWKEHIEWRDDADPKKRELEICAMLEFYLANEFSADAYKESMWELEFDIYSENTKVVCLEENE